MTASIFDRMHDSNGDLFYESLDLNRKACHIDESNAETFSRAIDCLLPVIEMYLDSARRAGEPLYVWLNNSRVCSALQAKLGNVHSELMNNGIRLIKM